ncbi:hypothetical protein COY17_00455 [Candidatus Saccharibacteria bacterium CG_4_10_14_0_2_um_filter_52_9]|nr:MAG: hypothetical protein COY17_00455 [Candidatus Saccharibacteria bacterium CG_4_10_14_0_2_um_filter_52_9]
MTCQNCTQSVEAGAVFCGNCGYPLQVNRHAVAQHPAYAVATPAQHRGETKALLSLLLGIIGIIGALFMALFGLVLGLAGLIMGTLSRSSVRRGISNAGLIFSSLAILTGLAVWTYAIKHDPRFDEHPPAATNQPAAPAIASADLSTHCYSTGFVDKLNVSNHSDSCDMSAFNGQTINSSTNAYKVYANTAQATTPNAFMGIAKQALEQDVHTNLSGFTIDSQQVGRFAGSPAYFVTASDQAHGIAIVEAAVLHQVASGENVFILVHAINGDKADLSVMEAQWQWK